MNQIGRRIRELRRACHISQQQLAVSIGISEKSLRRYENDILTPGIDVIKSVADYFGMTMEYLLGLMSYYDEIDFENKIKNSDVFYHYVNNLHHRVYDDEKYYWILINRKYHTSKSDIIMTYQSVESICEIDDHTMIINSQLPTTCRSGGL